LRQTDNELAFFTSLTAGSRGAEEMRKSDLSASHMSDTVSHELSCLTFSTFRDTREGNKGLR